MEAVIERKPIGIYIPYALLATALFSFYILAINKMELKPFEVEYPAEAFLAPQFELASLSGGKLRLADYRGKVVFINFWATWCATCKVEMPSMQRLYDRFKDRGFEMLTVSVDTDQALIQPFMKEYGLNFPVLLDPESQVAKKKYKTTGVPETFIVDRTGLIVHKAIGPREWDTSDTLSAFEKLLNEG
jgi:peroxiredoxin